MELWIRSQDEEVLIKVDKIFYWNTSPEMPSVGKHYLGNKEWIGNADYTKLGEYATKERALEVLDEIQKLLMPIIEYNPVVKKEESWEEEYQRTVLKGYDVKIKQAITYVYEMPKE